MNRVEIIAGHLAQARLEADKLKLEAADLVIRVAEGTATAEHHAFLDQIRIEQGAVDRRISEFEAALERAKELTTEDNRHKRYEEAKGLIDDTIKLIRKREQIVVKELVPAVAAIARALTPIDGINAQIRDTLNRFGKVRFAELLPTTHPRQQIIAVAQRAAAGDMVPEAFAAALVAAGVPHKGIPLERWIEELGHQRRDDIKLADAAALDADRMVNELDRLLALQTAEETTS